MRTSRSNAPVGDRQGVSDDTKMGLVLLVVAFLALGGYALFEFAGFIADVMSR